jgi:hypothetical protein
LNAKCRQGFVGRSVGGVIMTEKAWQRTFLWGSGFFLVSLAGMTADSLHKAAMSFSSVSVVGNALRLRSARV